ncbi:MAG: transposase [Chromatiaceae bacterium]
MPEDVRVDTRSRHETRILRDYDQEPQALTRERRGVWLVDRAFIDAPCWDAKQQALQITLIRRMKSNRCVDSTEGLPIAAEPANDGVLRDLRVTLSSSRATWRLITYRTRRGGALPFLTNDFSLLPGVVALLYFRRWEAEKCFDTWKNDFAQAKAWGKGRVAIAHQAQLAIITSLRVAILLHTRLGATAAQDAKALVKQDKRQKANLDDPDGTERPDGTAPLFRYTAQVSRQVLRFFKLCFLKPALPGL